MVYENLALLSERDAEVASAVKKELERQQNSIELIASENFVSEAVMAANASVLTNKYAEGYPAKRYYGGCECVDIVETIAIERAKKLFGAEFANVQPHSGAQANTAVYVALLQHGDTVMGMSLADGGHLTHGSPVNFSGINYNFVSYGVDPETGLIDYDKVEELALECKPKLIVAGASAYPRVIDFARFAEIAKKVGAYFMVDMAHIAGLVAAGVHPSPVPYADIVTTTTHKTLRGPRGGMILCNEEYIKSINSKVFPGMQGGPLEHVIAAKAICFGEAMSDDLKAYQKQIALNAKALSERLLANGVNLVSGGTDNHLMLVDLRGTETTGKDLETRLDSIGITVNKNAVPNDPRKPSLTSGIRVGTPAATTRGLVEEDFVLVADIITAAIGDDFEDKKEDLCAKVASICAKYPLYN